MPSWGDEFQTVRASTDNLLSTADGQVCWPFFQTRLGQPTSWQQQAHQQVRRGRWPAAACRCHDNVTIKVQQIRWACLMASHQPAASQLS